MKSILITVLFSLICIGSTLAQHNSPSDINNLIPRPYEYKTDEPYDGLTVQTGYITMRDGVKLAYDLYLPKGWKGEQLPALLHQTRYWRAPDLRWPFRLFSDGLIGPSGNMIKTVVNQGYAIVNVDSRGSGASFGSRQYPWTEDETKDGAEIIDWMIKQPWSNLNVGAMGVSYSGTTAEFLTVNQHPNLKAVLLMFSLYDVYDDIAYPGGIFHEFFVNNWGQFNSVLDANKLPRGNFLAKVLVKGVRKVDITRKNKTFKSAIQDHKTNVNVDEIAKGLTFRDQIFNDRNEIVDVFSPHQYSNKINESETAVYSYTGWWDGCYQHAAIKRHLNLTNPKNKLLIGPWEHGGQLNCSPANPTKSGFDHIGEILKFFDYHLKGIKNGLYEEPRVHYFTMNEESWKSEDNWPPKHETRNLFFAKELQLSFDPPTGEFPPTVYQVDTTTTTGDYSRWKSVIGMLKTPQVYPDRATQNKKQLCYTSAPLKTDMEITGHPIVTLYLLSDQPDGNFHVYLEEVLSDGTVRLITEGLLRGIHRKISTNGPLTTDAVPQRNYFETETSPLKKGEITELTFDLLPTSYLFKKDSRLRISLAGADQAHFSVMHPSEPVWKVYHSKQYPSHVILPIVSP